MTGTPFALKTHPNIRPSTLRSSLMPHPLLASANEASKPIWLVTEQTWSDIAGQLPQMAQGFAKAQGFAGKAGSHCLLPDSSGELSGVAFGINGADTKHSDPFL